SATLRIVSQAALPDIVGMTCRLGVCTQTRAHTISLLTAVVLCARCASANAGAEAPPPEPRSLPDSRAAALPRSSTAGAKAPPPDYRSSSPDTSAAAPRDSTTTAGGSAVHPGIVDTVTVLPPVHVTDERPIPERSTATTVRMDRAGIARFQPATA